MSQYLISHLVGPHGHLFHSHVVHVVLFGGSSRGTELDILRPEKGGRVKKVTQRLRSSNILQLCDSNQ